MKRADPFALVAVGVLLAGGVQAQQVREPLRPPAQATAPLEERIAAAQSVKVMDSIMGITLGSELDEAHEKLDPMCAPGTRPKDEGGEGKESDAAAKENDDTIAKLEPKSKPDADEGEGHKVLWQLAGTEYLAIYVTADEHERIRSITGILRPGKEVAFDEVGEVAKAPVHDQQAVVWDVLRPGQPLCRVLAKGAQGKASTITLLFAGRPTVSAQDRPAAPDRDKAD